jgi:hypothetical protein
MEIDLAKLSFSFSRKPLLIGGKAMEYYGLRPAGADIDFVITAADYARLAAQHPDHLKEIWGDCGVCVFEFEIWQSICLFGYDALIPGAVDAGEYLIISLEKLLFLKALGMREPKYLRDLQLVVNKVLQQQYQPADPS